MGLIALLVQMIDSGANLTLEGVRRKKSKENSRLYEALRSLDATSISEKLNPITLATFMNGGVTASSVKRLFGRQDFKAVLRELFLVCLVEERDSEPIKTVQASLILLAETVLSANSTVEDARAFGLALSEHLVDLAKTALKALDAVDPLLSQQMQQTALLKRMNSVLDNVSAHNRALVRFSDPISAKAKIKFVDNYRMACAERHGYITPPDFETNRKIPMEQLYVAPTILDSSKMHRDHPLELENFISTIDRTVVLGDPGGGKSTLSAFIASKLAKDEGGPVPIHVTLRYFAPHSEELSLLEFIEREMKPRYQLSPVDGLIEDLLITGNTIVIFDGLDELIDASKRREVTRSVEIFGMKYPHTPILVTSRRVGYEQARLDPAVFNTYMIDGFEQAEVERYVNNWFSSQAEFSEIEAKEQSEAFVEQSSAVRDLRSNPLMLALMCIIFRGEKYIPRNRPAVYEKCATLLFEKWDGHRGIEVPLQARDHVDAAMKFVAHEFMTSNAGDTGIPRQQVIHMLSEYLLRRAFENVESAERAATEFVDYCSGRAWVFTEAGATAVGEPIFTFAHRTFMEYFAAVHLTRITDTPEALANLLLPRIARQEWDVVAQLAVQQVDGSTDRGTSRCLTAMLRERRKRSTDNRGNVLTFIARCLAFSVVPPSLVREIATACFNHALETHQGNMPSQRASDPLDALRMNAEGMDAEFAAAQVADEMSAALGDPSRELAVLSIAYSWLIANLMNDFFGQPVGKVWLEVTMSFAKTNRTRLEEVTDSDTLFPLILGWHSLLTPEETQKAIDQTALDFCSRYFNIPKLKVFARHLPSLGEWFLYSSEADRSKLSEDKIAILDYVAAGIVRDFHSSVRVLPQSVEERKDLGNGPLFLFALSDKALPQVVTDALIIASLSSVEIHKVLEKALFRSSIKEMFIRHWNAAENGEGFGMLLRSASPEISEFAARWIKEEVTVFRNAHVASE